MRKVRHYFKKKPHMAIGVPALLCFLSFLTNLFAALRDGVIDGKELHQLLSTADGFETVALFIFMLVIKEKKK